MEGIICYIGIGSNLGDPLHHCKDAIEKLSCIDGISLLRISSFYRTEPVLHGESDSKEYRELSKTQKWFINAVAEVRTKFSPGDFLSVLQDIERSMGRIRKFKGAPRIIDLDLLFYGQEVIKTVNLILPHPEITKRRFVLEPLCEIASFFIHPAFGISIRGLKERLNDTKIVEIFAD